MAKLKRAGSTSWVDPSFLGNEEEVNATSEGPAKKICLPSANLWVEEFPPHNRDELSVNKKKVSEFFDRLQDAFHATRKKRIILLTGPSGCGKTATVKAICQKLRISIREWKNPSIHKYETYTELDGYMSQVDQFLEFVLRSSKYNSVCSTEESQNGRNVILIEELPNVFIRSPLDFHPILRKLSNSKCTNPIIFILSDQKGQILQRSLFPQPLQLEFSIANVEFNPVAATLMTSALNRVVSLVAKSSVDFSAPPKEVISSIVEGCNGDIRNAINSLQFTLRKKTNLSQISRHKYSRSGNKTKSKKGQTAQLETTFSGCKDTNIVLYRALGKILYCKRISDTKDSLPKHLKKYEREKLVEDQNMIFEKTEMDCPSKFCLFVHQNCPSFYQNIDDLASAYEFIGDSDIISSYWTTSNSLEEYNYSLAIRGVMFNLNSPVKSSFRSMTGPQWFKHRKTLSDRLHRMRHFYRKSCILRDEEVAVNIIPWTCKLNGLMLNPDESKLQAEIGLFNLKSRNQFNTSIHIDDVEDEVDSFAFTNDTSMECSEILNDQDLEEDFLIEEYED